MAHPTRRPSFLIYGPWFTVCLLVLITNIAEYCSLDFQQINLSINCTDVCIWVGGCHWSVKHAVLFLSTCSTNQSINRSTPLIHVFEYEDVIGPSNILFFVYIGTLLYNIQLFYMLQDRSDKIDRLFNHLYFLMLKSYKVKIRL